MFVAVFADVTEKFLHFGDFHHAGAAEGFERVVGEFSFANVAADHAFAIDSGETRVTHGAAFHFADRGAESVFLAHGSGNNFLEVHAHFTEKVFGQIAAVETDSLVGIGAVVVVPVEQRAGGSAGQGQHVHAEGPTDVGLASARKQVVAHHAHDGAGHDAEIFFQ